MGASRVIDNKFIQNSIRIAIANFINYILF